MNSNQMMHFSTDKSLYRVETQESKANTLGESVSDKGKVKITANKYIFATQES
jgi:uncharacterized membrane protein YcgQ (UPF0703/DUF1980 family)